MPKLLVTEFVVRNELGQFLASRPSMIAAMERADLLARQHPRSTFTVHEARHYCVEEDLLATVAGVAAAPVPTTTVAA